MSGRKRKYLAAALAGFAFFVAMPAASAGRHLAEEYADRVQRERQERMREEARAAQLREQEAMRRAAWEKERRREAERRAAEKKRAEAEETKAAFPAAREDAESHGAEAIQRTGQSRGNTAVREKERNVSEKAKRDEEKKGQAEPMAEEADETGEGWLRRLLHRAREKAVGAETAAEDVPKPILHAAEARPMKLLSAKATDTGGTLIFSDSPEYVKEPGILYTDIVKGDARVFYYHLNDTRQKLKVAVVLESVGGQYAVVRVTRRAVAGPDQAFPNVGKGIQRDFFADGQRTDKLYIGPAERRLLLEEPGRTVVPPGMLVSGMADFTASAPVRVSVLCCPTNKDPLQYVDEAKVLPADEHRLRGTFVGMDRILRIERHDPNADGAACVILADGGHDKYREGVDATDGSLVTNYGNYGVLYRIEAPASSRGKTQFLVSPMGGDFAGVVRVEAGEEGERSVAVPDGRLFFGETSVHPPFGKDGMTTLLPSVDIAPLGAYRGKRPVYFEFSPPGASNLPVMLILAPEDMRLAEGKKEGSS